MRHVFVVLAAVCTLAGCGEGEDAMWQDEPGLSSVRSALGAPSMDCYIDTPALDQYTTGSCIAYGSSPSIAVFRLNTPTPAAYAVWWDSLGSGYNHPECTGLECSVSISPGQRISMAAYYVTYTGTPTQGASATARYIY